MTDKYTKTMVDAAKPVPVKEFGAKIITHQGDDAESRLMTELAVLESKYLNSLRQAAREEFDARKSDYQMPSIEDINTQAQEEVDKLYQNKTQEKENEFESKLKKLEADILGVELKQSESVYDFNKQKYKAEKALYESIAKNGLNSSSIGELSKEGFSNNRSAEYSMILEQANLKVQKLEDDILDAKQKYEIALEGYEIAKAAELKKKIADLTYEAEKAAKVASDVNARVMAEEKEYFDAFNSLVKESELADSEKGSYEGYKKSNYEERYEIAKKFYSNLEAKTALAMIDKNTELKNKLGIYYEKLINDIKGE